MPFTCVGLMGSEYFGFRKGLCRTLKLKGGSDN